MHNADTTFYRRQGATLGAFTDPRVILVKPGDKRLAGVSSAPVCIEQEPGSPVYITITAGASDRALESIHAQYEVPLEGLLQFRAEREAELTAVS